MPLRRPRRQLIIRRLLNASVDRQPKRRSWNRIAPSHFMTDTSPCVNFYFTAPVHTPQISVIGPLYTPLTAEVPGAVSFVLPCLELIRRNLTHLSKNMPVHQPVKIMSHGLRTNRHARQFLMQLLYTRSRWNVYIRVYAHWVESSCLVP